MMHKEKKDFKFFGAVEEEFETYRSFVENSSDLLYRTDMDGKITYVSPSVLPLSGYTQEEAIGMKMAEEVYLYPEERELFLKGLGENGRVQNFEARLKRKDGSVWWASTNAGFFKDSAGNLLGIQGITRDITTLKEAARDLEESRERFRLAFHTSPDAVNLSRVSDGRFIDINQGFVDMTGYKRESAIGESSLKLNIWKYPEERAKFVEVLKRNRTVKNFEAQFLAKDGKTIIGLISASLARLQGEEVLLSIVRDISDLKQAQELMVQSEKMLSVGGLAAGMAHEINNPLAGIIQNADLLARRLEDAGMPANQKAAEKFGLDLVSLKKFMEERRIFSMAQAIRDSSMRIADIVKNMLSFARKSDASFGLHDPVKIMDEVLQLAETDYDLKKAYDFKLIVIQKEYENNLPAVYCEKSKIQQVLLNVLGNGAYAMFQAQALKGAPCFVIRIVNETDSRMIRFEIQDNGPGMDSITQKKIFEPFFTTKPAGIGTGLGLSVSSFIITETHKGSLSVDSAPGSGAIFTVRLPISGE